MREFFNLDNPRNAETNDDDDQPGADESDTQVTNNVTLNLDVLQQAYYLHYLLFYYEQYHAPISIAAVPHLPVRCLNLPYQNWHHSLQEQKSLMKSTPE